MNKERYFAKTSITISIIFFLFSISAIAQKRDTLLIKYFNTELVQIVFIDSPNSIYHHKILELLNDKRMYMKSTTPSYGNNLFNNGEWISVKPFNGKYYAYFPSEPFANTYLSFNEDSITVNDFNDGLITYKITKIKRNRNKMILFFENQEKTRSSFRFKRINNEFIALKSSYFVNNESIFITNSNKFLSIPIIVNFCPDNRCPEFMAN
jgi:hypothetical protein